MRAAWNFHTGNHTLPAARERSSSMERGRVKWFDDKKGYGFIASESGQDVFAHFKCIDETGFKSLDEGDEVTFDIEQGAKGPMASHIRKLN